jgi:trk system potassium uptake protein
MRVIIVGGGEVGFALARTLSRQHDLFVIDHDPAVADRFRGLDVEFVTGSGTSEPILRRVEIEHANLFVACTGLDEVNIVACAMASRLGSVETICFVSRDELVRPLGGSGSLREHFGIQRVIWPEAQLAEDIERIVVAPGAIDAEVFAGGRVRLLEYRLEADSPFLHIPLAELHLPIGSLIVALKRGREISVPRGTTTLEPGDKIIVMGTHEAMREVQMRVDPDTRARRGRRQVTIIGGGDVGFRLAQRLDSRPEIRLRVIERDRPRGELLAATLSNALVINGDGTDLELLESEEIGRSDVLVSVIDNDERNLLASLLGRQLGARKVITRVSKPANLHLFERVGIDVPISARGAAVAAVVHHIDGGKSNLLAVLEEGQGRILELKVPSGYRATRLKDLGAPRDSIVATILRNGQPIVPRGDDIIQPGDDLLVFCTVAALDRVRDFFSRPAG